MKLIVNADKNWGIGKGNELLVHIPSDMKFSGNDDRTYHCYGKKDIGKLSKSNAASQTDKYCANDKQRL